MPCVAGRMRNPCARSVNREHVGRFSFLRRRSRCLAIPPAVLGRMAALPHSHLHYASDYAILNRMRRKSFQKMHCPIARSLERVGEWWSMLILRDALHGYTRFEEFRESLDRKS